MTITRPLLFTALLATSMSASSQLIFLGTNTPKDGAYRGIYPSSLPVGQRACSRLRT